MLCKFWKFTQRGDLKSQAPIIQCQISAWVRDGPPQKKAICLTKEQRIAVYNLPLDDPTSVTVQAYMPIGECYGSRGMEITDMDWSEVTVDQLKRGRMD